MKKGFAHTVDPAPGVAAIPQEARPADRIARAMLDRVSQALFECHQREAYGASPGDDWNTLAPQQRRYGRRMGAAAIEALFLMGDA